MADTLTSAANLFLPFKVPLQSQKTLFLGFHLRMRNIISCTKQHKPGGNHASNSCWKQRMATASQFWIWHCHTKTRDVTVSASEKGSEAGFALRLLPLLVLLSIMWHCCTKMGSNVWPHSAFLGKQIFKLWFHMLLFDIQMPALQQGTLIGIVYDKTPFIWLQFESWSFIWSVTCNTKLKLGEMKSTSVWRLKHTGISFSKL